MAREWILLGKERTEEAKVVYYSSYFVRLIAVYCGLVWIIYDYNLQGSSPLNKSPSFLW